MFDVDDHGIVSAGLTALAIDLDFEFGRDLPLFEESAELATCAVVPDRAGVKSLLGLVRVEAPEEFQPTDRRLSISDLHWIDIAKRSSYRTTEFDPWSRYLLREFQSALVR